MPIIPPFISNKHGITETTGEVEQLPPVYNFVSSTGPLLGTTTNYGLNLTNFNWITWHTYEWENWAAIDTMLDAAIGFLNLRGVWRGGTAYIAGQTVLDPTDLTTLYKCLTPHTASDTWLTDKPLYWEERIDSDPNVTSVHSRIGDVVGVLGDYSADLITFDNAGTDFAAINVSAALIELEGDIDAAETTLQANINAVESDLAAAETSWDAALTAGLATKVDLAGDTMTGGLNISPASGTASFTLNKPTGADVCQIGLRDENGHYRTYFNLLADDGFAIGKQDSSGTFVGNILSTPADSVAVTFGSSVTAPGNFYVEATSVSNAHYWMRDTSARGRGVLYYSRTDNGIRLACRDTSGNVQTQVACMPTEVVFTGNVVCNNNLDVIGNIDMRNGAIIDVTTIYWDSNLTSGDYMYHATGNGTHGYENGSFVWRLGNGGSYPTRFTSLVGNTTASTGNVYASGDGSLYRSTSSGEFKVERLDLDNSLEKIKSLNPQSYKSTHVADEGKRFTGFIAEEVVAVIPEADVDNGGNYDTRAVLSTTVAALQELADLTEDVPETITDQVLPRLDALETAVTDLINRVQTLEAA